MRSGVILLQSVIASILFTSLLGCRAVERSQSMLLSQNAAKSNPAPTPSPSASPTATATPTPGPSPTSTPTSFPVAGSPLILYTDIIAGANSGIIDTSSNGTQSGLGSYLSIFGKNFGNNLSDVKVFIGTSEVARYIYLGPSNGRPDIQQLSVQLGPSNTSGAIRVKVKDLESNTDKFFTVRPGNFYFVSTTGNNTTGQVNDISRPYRTANFVMSGTSITAGDFMVLRGGTFDLSSGNEDLHYNRWLNIGNGLGGGNPTRSGTSDTNAITVYGHPGETVTIDWGTDTTNGISGIKNAVAVHYYVFANIQFNLRESGGSALELGSYTARDVYITSPRMVNLKVFNGMANAEQYVNTVYIQRAPEFKLYGLSIGNQSPQAYNTLRSHIIYISHEYTNGDMGWCYVHDNAYGRAALQIAGDARGSTPYLHGPGEAWGYNTNVRIHDNRFENLPQEAILTNLGSTEIFIYNNVIKNATTKGAAGTSPISLRGDYGGNTGKYYLYNNTVYTDAPGGLFELGMGAGGTYPELVVLQNNIFYVKALTATWYQLAASLFNPTIQVKSANNIWYGSSTPMPAFAGADDVSINPGFLDLLDLRLGPGSSAATRGVPLTLFNHNYDGDARLGTHWALGAY